MYLSLCTRPKPCVIFQLPAAKFRFLILEALSPGLCDHDLPGALLAFMDRLPGRERDVLVPDHMLGGWKDGSEAKPVGKREKNGL